MNPSSLDNPMSLLSEPIGPIHESDLVSWEPRRDIIAEPVRQPQLPPPLPSPTLPCNDCHVQCDPDIVWTQWDVPIGRGRAVREFVGNTRYRELIEQYRPTYLAVQKRKEKREVSTTVYNIIKSNGGRFLAPSSKTGESWYEISKEKSLAKIGQALRIGLRPPQFVSSSWTYPVDAENRRRVVPSRLSSPSHPLVLNLPFSASESYWRGQTSSCPSDYVDTISNLSFTSDDQLTAFSYGETEGYTHNRDEWNSTYMAEDPLMDSLPHL